jgi:GNAT superfamily N-acetyltransferase
LKPQQRRKRKPGLDIECHPVTPDRWPDMRRLFGEHGACGGCWCMWWRLTAREYEAGKGEPNRKAMQRLVAAGGTPGLLAYRGEEPVGWCAIGPRAEFPRLARSRILAPVDDQPVWSIVCLFVARPWRGKGVASALIRAAAEHARGQGARIIEAYAVEPRQERMPDTFAYHGPAAAYRAAGFREVARRSPTRPVMRRKLR